MKRKSDIEPWKEGGVRDDNEADPISYSTRAVGDFVLSGPLYPAGGRGRTFFKPSHALAWAAGKYGEANVSLLPPPVPENSIKEVKRWAILVKAAAVNRGGMKKVSG